jgi:hypothetical protein
VYQGNKQNAAEIKKVNEKVDKILEMLTSKWIVIMDVKNWR